MHSILLSRGYFCLHSGTPRVQRQQSISNPMWLHVLGHDVPGNCFPRNLHRRRQLRCIYRRHCSIRPLVYPRRWPLKRRLAPELLCLCLCVRANDFWNCLRHRRPQHIYFPCKKQILIHGITSVDQQWAVVHTFSWHFAEKRFLWQRNKHNRLGRRFHHISADHCLRALLWHSLGVCRWTAIASSYSRAANGIVYYSNNCKNHFDFSLIFTRIALQKWSRETKTIFPCEWRNVLVALANLYTWNPLSINVKSYRTGLASSPPVFCDFQRLELLYVEMLRPLNPNLMRKWFYFRKIADANSISTLEETVHEILLSSHWWRFSADGAVNDVKSVDVMA